MAYHLAGFASNNRFFRGDIQRNGLRVDFRGCKQLFSSQTPGHADGAGDAVKPGVAGETGEVAFIETIAMIGPWLIPGYGEAVLCRTLKDTPKSILCK